MSCRICKSQLREIIDFGKISLVGQFYKKKNKAKKYKITLCFCSKCKHVQIKQKINPDLLFKNYLWETGVSKSNILIINELIKYLNKFKINKNSKVLEIASNDGVLLNIFQKKLNCLAVGIDPAKNLAKKKRFKNIKRIIDYFNYNSSKLIAKKFGLFNFIIARNVLAHVKNPNEILKGVYKLLDYNGLFIIEFPSLLNIIKFNQYDNIFHEHIGFHSLKSIQDLCAGNNLKLVDCQLIESQGGSLRCFITKKDSKIKINKKIKKFLKIEKLNGLFDNSKLFDFKNKINSHRKNLYKLIKNLKKKKFKISAYAASGKGQALLQYCKIENDFLDFIFDKSSLKQNKYTSGTNILIKKPSDINKKKVDYLLLLSWNLIKEIKKQEYKFIKSGGKFITPYPKPSIIHK